jgi:hypothetical protein
MGKNLIKRFDFDLFLVTPIIISGFEKVFDCHDKETNT